MESELFKSMSVPPQTHSCSSCGGNKSETSSFECNICLDWAQDPIVTLCGHLFCWPCLYKWLHIGSQSQDCPVCKAMIEVQKLVPLYGRGKNSNDPRSKSIPDVSIPSRPAGQRPATAPPRETIYYGPHSFGPEPGPMTSARFGNFMFSTAFGGLIPSLFNLQVHEYATLYSPRPMTGFPDGYGYSYHGGHALGFIQHWTQGQHGDLFWKMVFLLVGLLIIFVGSNYLSRWSFDDR